MTATYAPALSGLGRRAAKVICGLSATVATGCTTVHVPGAERATYVGIVRVVGDVSQSGRVIDEGYGVLGAWRASELDQGDHAGVGWRFVHRLVFARDCRVIFNVATEQQLGEVERLIASSSEGGSLCVALKASR